MAATSRWVSEFSSPDVEKSRNDVEVARSPTTTIALSGGSILATRYAVPAAQATPPKTAA